MKKKVLLRAIAVVLVFSLLPVNASAVEINGWNSRKTSGRGWLENIILSLWDRITGNDEQPGQEKPEETGSDLTLVTDSTTVENGDMLRASTYELTTGNAAAADTTTTLKYFPVTLYKYDTDVINAATHEAELIHGTTPTKWEGIYFSDGKPAAESFRRVTATPHTDLTWQDVINGTYSGDPYCITKVEVTPLTEVRYSYSAANVSKCSELVSRYSGSSNSWKPLSYYYQPENDTQYYQMYYKYTYSYSYGYSYSYTWGYWDHNKEEHITIGTQTETSPSASLSIDTSRIFSRSTSTVTVGYTMSMGSRTLADLVGTDTTAKVGVTLYTESSYTYTSALVYEDWNWWNKNTNDNANGQKFYTGLAEATLDADKNIVLTKPDGGIFDDDDAVKDIYREVSMPFVYDSEKHTYTFDAAVNGVYFHEDEEQESSAKAESYSRLYFDEGQTQTNNGSYGDGSKTVWAPFNDSLSFQETEMNYHFGMQATIPFTMTTNGCLNANEDDSDPIKFSFSGDDDVWVFIDGKLVVDLGGIHNRLDATINFATNQVTYSANNTLSAETGSYNEGAGFDLTQTLLSTETETGLIDQDLATFAATSNHELTIYYLERGEGSSNCQIVFNLPMNDRVDVIKRITRSYCKIDGEDVYTPLTEKEQQTVNNIDFGFTLYRREENETFAPVANREYALLNSNGQVIDVPSTDANGHFILRNGQIARFIGDMGKDGVYYYVVEDSVEKLGFVAPDYLYNGVAAGGFDADGVHYTRGGDIPRRVLELDAEQNDSTIIKVTGSEESTDILEFLCENFWNADMPNPSVYPAEDRIVLDYGLAVEIDALTNDVYRGDSIELESVSGSGLEVDPNTGIVKTPGNVLNYGTAEIKDGKIIYRLKQQLTGVEVLNYKVKVTGSEMDDEGTQTVAYKYAVGTVYIIPATVIYYEENLDGLVTFTGKGWSEDLVQEPEFTAEFQEPGRVSTADNSPYGSDVAYLQDSHDSNGTSKYASTENGAVKFEYTFTGTGSSFFARTSNNTGYMYVTLTNEATQEVIQKFYRDTYYKTENDQTMLYNIPVVTFHNLTYGTYKVTVLVAKKNVASNGTVRFHSDFWLDGIRVFNPLSSQDDNYSIAMSAYAADGEANMKNVTLRNKLLSEADINEDGTTSWKDGANFVVFTDTNGTIETVEEYKSKGPKEEVYLNDGQSVTFSLKNWDPNSNRIYLGMKAPTGNAQVMVGRQNIVLKNAVDCYYNISQYATVTEVDGVKVATFRITAGTGALVSLTNIKVTGNAEFTIIDGSQDIDKPDAGDQEQLDFND